MRIGIEIDTEATTIKDWIQRLNELAAKANKGLDTDIYFENNEDGTFWPKIEIEQKDNGYETVIITV